jgi:hypothetical protein
MSTYLDGVLESGVLHLSGQLFVEAVPLLLLLNAFLRRLYCLLLLQLGLALLAPLCDLQTSKHKSNNAHKSSQCPRTVKAKNDFVTKTYSTHFSVVFVVVVFYSFVDIQQFWADEVTKRKSCV